MSFPFRSVAIVGSGAIGLYYGGRLAAAGVDVRFLLRSDYDVISKSGLRVQSVDGDFVLPSVQAYRTAEEIGPVDLVIVSWKATANASLAKVLPPLLQPATEVLTLQNGLGNCEVIAEIVGAERVLAGLCFVCLNRIEPGVVVHTAGGKIRIGEFAEGESGRADELAKLFKKAEISCESVDHLARAQWEKLSWNIPFNGLAVAEGGVTTDVLLGNDVTENRVRALMHEVLAAANGQGLGLAESLVDWNIERTKAMGAYRPSTMIDFVDGKEIELGPIWEEPLRRAKAAGVATPELETLVTRIKARLEEHGIPY